MRDTLEGMNRKIFAGSSLILCAVLLYCSWVLTAIIYIAGWRMQILDLGFHMQVIEKEFLIPILLALIPGLILTYQGLRSDS
jgi:hypothetical protein